MILILSENFDLSTNLVLDWLIYHFKVPFIRLNDSDDFKLINYNLEKNQYNVEILQKNIDLAQIKSVWFRRSLLKISENNFLKESEFNDPDLYRYLKIDGISINFFSNYILTKSNVIGSFASLNVCKLHILKVAEQTNLKIPRSILTTNKIELYDFIKICKNGIITKTLDAGYTKYLNDEVFQIYTNCLNEEDIDLIPDTFMPSFFQENIKKKYELRVFFFDSNFYTMAIFSQNDVKTSIDFRRYNRENPNRFVPYILPKVIQKRLKSFFSKIRLNSGSVDIIVDLNNNFYFLEVNPIGQFEMVSSPCNYHLNEKIAKYLTNEN